MTQEEAESSIEQLEGLLARGEGTVQFGGRLTVYKSTDSIMKALAYFKAELAKILSRNRQRLGYASKGF